MSGSPYLDDDSGDSGHEAGVEDAGDDFLGGRLFDQAGDSLSGGDFMLVRDLAYAIVERAPEDTREGNGVVDLVREIRTSSGNDGCTGFASDIGHDLGGWVRKCKDDRVWIHRFNHLGS